MSEYEVLLRLYVEDGVTGKEAAQSIIDECAEVDISFDVLGVGQRGEAAERARAAACTMLAGLVPGNTGINMANELADKVVAAFFREPLTLGEVESMARVAHLGQTDKSGSPYLDHVRGVASGLTGFGEEMVMAGLLHDVIEDTEWTTTALLKAGVSPRVVSIVEAVTNTPGTSYQEKMTTITQNPDATLVKISDNAHNSRADRLAKLPEQDRARLEAKYRKARKILWNAASADDVRTIVGIVNPDLLDEL